MTGNDALTVLTTTHSGTYKVRAERGRLVSVEPWEGDPDPSIIGQSLMEAADGPLRVSRPAFRRGWLDALGKESSRADGKRGADPFVELPWDEAFSIVAAELDRIRKHHGNEAIYGGSYGWASAGRFHHAQSQLHRFLNVIGGYTASVHSYSYGAAEVILPHIIGNTDGLTGHHSTWDGIADEGGLVVTFGGMPRRNAQIQGGGVARHEMLGAMERAAKRNVRFVNISPVRDDAPDGVVAEWLAPRPNTDTAVMLGLAYVLIREKLCDRDFLARYCVGFEAVKAYIRGEADGIAKTPEWAETISGIQAGKITALARDMAAQRTMIMVNWAIQRADHGEQPYWMAITLAAMLGYIGLPGGGFGFGYSSTNGAGRPELGFRWPSFPQGKRPISTFIPVARLTEMLLQPGGRLDFNGQTLTYPDIRLIYWAGGNPFHHHHDINRLVEAWQKPETIIVHEPHWTATARHADIVLPVTTTLERNDLAFATRENVAVAMKQAIPPVGESRDDFTIFKELSIRLGIELAFTGGRTAEDWIEAMYGDARENAARQGMDMPVFREFWQRGYIEVKRQIESEVLLGAFRADPIQNRLATPSGRIELFSKRIASFGYDDCPGHAVWLEPKEWLGSPMTRHHPLHLLSPQPADKLHSQYDHGSVSRATKRGGRTPVKLNPQDAAARGIRDGDIVRIFNDRGECLASAVLTDAVARGVMQMPTGAWYDPAEPGKAGSLEKHGNPNVLTPDRGTSRLAQGSSCNSCLVDVAAFAGEPPPVSAFDPPAILPTAFSILDD